MGVPVSREQLQAGNPVFYRWLGQWGCTSAASTSSMLRTGDVVKISSLYEPYYVAGWVGARRVL